MLPKFKNSSIEIFGFPLTSHWSKAITMNLRKKGGKAKGESKGGKGNKKWGDNGDVKL